MRKCKHGMSGTRIHNIWRDMRHRCNIPGMKNYKDYGGRGIKVCKAWNEDFKSFYNWAISNGYKDNLSLDRIDVNGNYEPNNCRWADKSTQMANRRNVGKCEYIGVSLHSNGSCYVAMIKKNKEILFFYSSRSKNDCARKRNEYILSHNLKYPLNEIFDEYEDIRVHKNDCVYSATSKDDGSIIETSSMNELSERVCLSKTFIHDCIRGTRNSKKYIFRKRCMYEIT